VSVHICEQAENDEMMGICMEVDHPNESFTYFIGAESKNDSETFDSKEIPAGTWAVFTSVGPMPQAIRMSGRESTLNGFLQQATSMWEDPSSSCIRLVT
jgi:predicted transcriptional regulator YdeE